MPTFRSFNSRTAPAGLFVCLLAGTASAGDEKIAATYLTPEVSRVLIAPEGQFRSSGRGVMAITPDGKTLVRVRADGAAKVWELPSGKKLASFDTADATIHHVALAPDGRTLLAVGKNQVALWDVTSRKRSASIAWEKTYAAVFVPAGRALALRGEGKAPQLWDLDGQMKPTVRKEAPAFGTDCDCVAFSPDGRTLAVGLMPGHGENALDTWRVTLWEVAGGKKLRTLAAPPVSDLKLAFSPDGKTLALSGEGRDRIAWLWDIERERRVSIVAPAKNQEPIVHLSFSQDGRTIVTTQGGGLIRLWERATQRERLILDGFRDTLHSVLTPDGQTLLSLSADGTVLEWDLPKIVKLQRAK